MVRSRTRSPQSCSRISPAWRCREGVACWPGGNRSVRRRLCNPHSLHVRPVPPPLRLRTLEPPVNSASGQGDRHQPGLPGSRWSVGGKAPTHPGPQPQLHPQQTYCKVWLRSSSGAVGRTAPVLSAPGGGSPLCREPHWARTSAWRRRPSSPAASSPARAPQLPAVCIPPPAATPASAGSRFASAETLRLRARSPRPPRPLAEAPAPGATQTGDQRGARRASAFEELAELRADSLGTVLEYPAAAGRNFIEGALLGDGKHLLRSPRTPKKTESGEKSPKT